ncbi:MAG: hypothetical protein K8E66_02725, partial [Phycisphaerales bacterium]|nr:hypothetical protein [Phycisphaerales bacterium]
VRRLSAALTGEIGRYIDEGLTDEIRSRIDARLADRGERVRLAGGSEPIEGVLVGVGPDGALVLEIGGERRSFVSGEMSCRGLGDGPPREDHSDE